MRLFQNSGLYPRYLKIFNSRHSEQYTFSERLQAFLNDRFGALHFLLPVLESDPNAFFTNGDDAILQRAWARENNLPTKISLEDILLAQLESHQTEVFYNLDPVRYGSNFVRRLPSCVKKTVCWRAAPSPGADFSEYDRVVCNFPSIIESWQKQGWHGAYLTPAYDPVMDEYASSEERPIDVLFIGGYSRHHIQRSETLESVSQLALSYRVSYHIDMSRITRLANSPLGLLPGVLRHRMPSNVKRITSEPVFGRELYRLMSQAKIILNGAIDMAGEDRGNMRCFEALGCGALMMSDHGHYPSGFVNGNTMLTYRNADDAAVQTAQVLNDWEQSKNIAKRGNTMIRNNFSKSVQWKMFQDLLG